MNQADIVPNLPIFLPSCFTLINSPYFIIDMKGFGTSGHVVFSINCYREI